MLKEPPHQSTRPEYPTMPWFHKKLKNVICEYNRLNGWISTLQAAWYIRRARIIWFLRTKPTRYDIIDTQFYIKYRLRVFYVLSLRRIKVGDSPRCCQGQQDDFPSPFCALKREIPVFDGFSHCFVVGVVPSIFAFTVRKDWTCLINEYDWGVATKHTKLQIVLLL